MRSPSFANGVNDVINAEYIGSNNNPYNNEKIPYNIIPNFFIPFVFLHYLSSFALCFIRKNAIIDTNNIVNIAIAAAPPISPLINAFL